MRNVIPLEASNQAAIRETLYMVDPRRWGVRLMIVQEVLRLESESDDGWAYVSAKRLATKLGISPRYVWDLIGTGKKRPGQARPPGSMWRTEWVLQLGDVGAGSRGTQYRVNPRVEHWRCVPWVETDAEKRRLRVQAARRGWISSAMHVAEQSQIAPRSVAELIGEVLGLLRDEIPAFGENHGLCSATHRGASDSPPLSKETRDGEGDQTKPLSQAERARVDTIIRAIMARTALPVNATLDGELCSLLAGRDFDVDHLVHAVDNAPYDLKPPMIIRSYLPAVLKGDISVMRLADLDATPGGYPAAMCEMELASIDQAIANWRAEGAEPPRSLLDDRERWQTELDHSRRSRRA